MGTTRWVIPVAAMSIVLLAGGGRVSAQGKQKPEKTAMLVAPKSPSGWYTTAEFEQAVRAAEILGRPMVLMYQNNKSSCPKHNNQRDAWLRATQLTAFVRVIVDAVEAKPVELLQKLRREAGDKAGRYVPQLFLGKPSGEFLGVVPYRASMPQFMAAVGGALKTFGVMLPPKTIIDMWNKLERARTNWSSGKIAAAMKCYRDIKQREDENPNLSIFVEARKDEEQINKKGAEEVAEAKLLYDLGEQSEARAAVTKICRRYTGFKPAEDARALRSTAKRRATGTSDAPTQADAECRTWTDITGKHQIEAELVTVKQGLVRLKKISGEYIDIRISQLGLDDQKFVQRWMARYSGRLK